MIATEKREDLEYEKEKQQAYYDVLAASDEQADSTTFIEVYAWAYFWGCEFGEHG